MEQACEFANVADRTAMQRYPGWTTYECRDGFVNTAPVGSYRGNGFGLHDMLGNVWEWVADCWNDDYQGAPEDGTAWTSGNCKRRILRGGSWYSGSRYVRSANRGWTGGDSRENASGFRLARSLP